MNQEAILWMFGIVQTVICLAITGGLAWLLIIVQRLTKVETILALFAEKAAAILHSPHTPELDKLLEKYCDREYELSDSEWRQLMAMTFDIEGFLSHHPLFLGERVEGGFGDSHRNTRIFLVFIRLFHARI